MAQLFTFFKPKKRKTASPPKRSPRTTAIPKRSPRNTTIPRRSPRPGLKRRSPRNTTIPRRSARRPFNKFNAARPIKHKRIRRKRGR